MTGSLPETSSTELISRSFGPITENTLPFTDPMTLRPKLVDKSCNELPHENSPILNLAVFDQNSTRENSQRINLVMISVTIVRWASLAPTTLQTICTKQTTEQNLFFGIHFAWHSPGQNCSDTFLCVGQKSGRKIVRLFWPFRASFTQNEH